MGESCGAAAPLAGAANGWSMADLFKSESDVRAWVRKVARGKDRWVEPNAGSTNGLPDVWVPIVGTGVCVHLELKLGYLMPDELRFNVRGAQRRELKRMINDGVPCGLAVGLAGTSEIAILRPKEQVLKGRVPGGWVALEDSWRGLKSDDADLSFWSAVHWLWKEG